MSDGTATEWVSTSLHREVINRLKGERDAARMEAAQRHAANERLAAANWELHGDSERVCGKLAALRREAARRMWDLRSDLRDAHSGDDWAAAVREDLEGQLATLRAAITEIAADMENAEPGRLPVSPRKLAAALRKLVAA